MSYLSSTVHLQTQEDAHNIKNNTSINLHVYNTCLFLACSTWNRVWISPTTCLYPILSSLFVLFLRRKTVKFYCYTFGLSKKCSGYLESELQVPHVHLLTILVLALSIKYSILTSCVCPKSCHLITCF